VAVLPTPQAGDGERGGTDPATRTAGRHQVNLTDAATHLTTPPAASAKRPAAAMLPTPSAANPNDGEDPRSWLARQARQRRRRTNGNGMGMPLSVAAALLATPTASDARACVHHSTGTGPSLTHQIRLLPTPRASDATKGSPHQHRSRGDLMLPSAVTRITTPTRPR